MSMGTREPTKGGSERDMSSRKARRYCGGSFKWVKRKFWKRVRKSYKAAALGIATCERPAERGAEDCGPMNP